MAELDTSPAPWLQRAWSPRETFDPTPWLQERYRRQVEQAKLPLQLQGLALQNQAQQLQIEHQGVVNDEFNDELKKEADDLPTFKERSIMATNLPGGALDMETPVFASKKYNEFWKQRMLMDANSRYNDAMHQAIVAQTKQAADVTSELKRPVPRLPNGMFDEDALAKMSTEANLQRAAREQAAKVELAQARQEHFAEDRPMREAARVAELRSQIDASKAITDKAAEMTPEIQAELDNQKKAQYELDALQKNTAVTPQVQMIEGKKFLINPKTGAVHEISKEISKQQFMAQHIGQWMRDNFGMTKEEVAKDMSDFYDKNIAPSSQTNPTVFPPGKSVRVKKPDGTIGFLPAYRLDEAIRAGWSKVE